MPLPGGITRETARGRFTSFDQQLQLCLHHVFMATGRFHVEDWASSNGITSAEWFTTLQKEFPKITFTASDHLLYLIEVRKNDSAETYIVQPDGEPVQYIRPPFVVSLARPQRPFWIVNRHLQKRALSTWQHSLRQHFQIPSDWKGMGEWVNCPPFVMRKISLVHPDVAELCGEQFRIREHSIFESLSEPADVIRTMNILNHSYFSQQQLRRAIAVVQQSLKPGGVWIVGRTVREKPPQHQATVFRKTTEGWHVLLRVDVGSEIESLAQSSPQLEGSLSSVE